MENKLETEAEEYIKELPFEEGCSVKTHFIEGANSKYVQIEKIKAQINMLRPLEYAEELDSIYIHDTLMVLRQELKELENGNK
jgi:hypothetical protein